jgi:multisubunit Na+/H+ antiporter MnhC subunit
MIISTAYLFKIIGAIVIGYAILALSLWIFRNKKESKKS